MGNWYRTLLTIAICAIFAVFVNAQDDDDNDDLPPEGNIVVVDSAFVRSGPSNDYLAVGALFEGDQVIPVNISADGQWILIPYSRGNGWVQRNLVRWEDDAELDLLPVLEANITPTPRIAVTNTPFIPTSTPEGNYVNVAGAASAYVRAGPGRGFLRLGQLLPGTLVEALARNEETTWIMVRFSEEPLVDGFGWVAVDLVYWENYAALTELPIIDLDNLTPTVTFTPSPTASTTTTATITQATSTASVEATIEASITNTNSPTETATPEPSATNTASPTATDEPTSTDTSVPSETATSEPSATNTASPTATATHTPTATNTPTETATTEPSATDTAVPTATATHTATASDTPTPTETATLEPTTTDTAVPTETPSEIVAAAIVASETESPVPSNTASPTPTSTSTQAVTDIFAIQETSVAAEATSNALDTISEPPNPSILEETPADESDANIPIEAIVGILVLLVVLAYIWFYWQGLSAAGRYNDGFVTEECPVCHRGHLQVDERQSRTFGIPTVRRTIRCDACRSVLREVGTQRWRYAVDRLENTTMYDRFNGRELTDADLQRLTKTPPSGAKARTSPEFLENDPEE